MIRKSVFYMLTLSILSVPYAFASENLFQFQAPDIDGEKLSLRQFEGQVVLVVNTASKCGYTYQYEGLEKVYRQFKDRGFVVLGFPHPYQIAQLGTGRPHVCRNPLQDPPRKGGN